jgi:hypothetical protein
MLSSMKPIDLEMAEMEVSLLLLGISPLSPWYPMPLAAR